MMVSKFGISQTSRGPPFSGAMAVSFREGISFREVVQTLNLKTFVLKECCLLAFFQNPQINTSK